MAVFSTDGVDDERLKTYILSRVPPVLKTDLDGYILNRTATFAARRQGGAVQSISAEADRTALLRFYGYLERLQRLPPDASLSITLLCRGDLGDLAQGYATWLQNNQHCKFSTIANYLNGLVSMTTHAYANFQPAAEVLNAVVFVLFSALFPPSRGILLSIPTGVYFTSSSNGPRDASR